MKGKKGGEGDTPQLPLPSHSSVCTFSCIQKIKFRVGGQGETLMSTATSVDRITVSETQEGRNVYFKTCDSGPFLLFAGGID